VVNRAVRVLLIAEAVLTSTDSTTSGGGGGGSSGGGGGNTGTSAFISEESSLGQSLVAGDVGSFVIYNFGIKERNLNGLSTGNRTENLSVRLIRIR